MKHRFFLFIFVILILTVAAADNFTDIKFRQGFDTAGACTFSGILYKPVRAKENTFCFKTKKENIRLTVTGLTAEELKMYSKGVRAEIDLIPKLPSGASNFGEFDYRQYLLGKNIFAISEIRAEEIHVLKKNPFNLTAFGSKIRYFFGKTVSDYLDDESAAFTEAIITGETGELDDSDISLIRKAGVSHLTAVSGMHVMYYILPVRKILRNKKTGLRMRNLILMPFLILFASIADFSCSVMRAVITNVIICFSGFFEKPYDKFNGLGLSGTIQMIINPYSIYNSGFVLSYLSVFAIYSAVPFLKNVSEDTFGPVFREKSVFNLREYIINGLITSFAVNVVLMPAVIMYYGEVSLLGILVNIPASPLTCLIFILGFKIVLLSLFNIGFLSSAVSYILEFLCGIFRFILDIAGRLSEIFGVYSVACPDIFSAAAYYMVLLTLIFSKRQYKRAAVYISFAVIFTLNMASSVSQKSMITVLDVKQSSCALITTSDGKNILIDTGDGQTDVAELIKKYGVKKLDILVLSHGHSDHSGGMDNIIDNFEIDTFVYPDNKDDTVALHYAEILRSKGTETKGIKGNTSLGLSLRDSAELYFYRDEDLNNSSVAAVWTLQGVKTLFGADIKEETEKKLCASGLLTDIDILVAPHHGSKFSATEEFLTQTMPEYVIISVGKYNMYGHPSDEALERFESIGAEIFRTDEDGAVRISVTGEGEYEIWAKNR